VRCDGFIATPNFPCLVRRSTGRSSFHVEDLQFIYPFLVFFFYQDLHNVQPESSRVCVVTAHLQTFISRTSVILASLRVISSICDIHLTNDADRTVPVQVFVRELISNASDALEKLRYLTLTGQVSEGPDARPLEIHIGTDKLNGTLTVQVSHR